MYFQKLIIKSKRLGHQKQPIHATNLKFHNIFFISNKMNIAQKT